VGQRVLDDLIADWKNLIGVMENLLDEKSIPEGENHESH
jgi:rRNA pseudouridine-1189 N-methylase Emg1 (Nep1/Mra1 family)